MVHDEEVQFHSMDSPRGRKEDAEHYEMASSGDEVMSDGEYFPADAVLAERNESKKPVNKLAAVAAKQVTWGWSKFRASSSQKVAEISAKSSGLRKVKELRKELAAMCDGGGAVVQAPAEAADRKPLKQRFSTTGLMSRLREKTQIEKACEEKLVGEDDLLPGWVKYTTEDGRDYYHHAQKQITQWNKPECPEQPLSFASTSVMPLEASQGVTSDVSTVAVESSYGACGSVEPKERNSDKDAIVQEAIRHSLDNQLQIDKIKVSEATKQVDTVSAPKASSLPDANRIALGAEPCESLSKEVFEPDKQLGTVPVPTASGLPDSTAITTCTTKENTAQDVANPPASSSKGASEPDEQVGRTVPAPIAPSLIASTADASVATAFAGLSKDVPQSDKQGGITPAATVSDTAASTDIATSAELDRPGPAIATVSADSSKEVLAVPRERELELLQEVEKLNQANEELQKQLQQLRQIVTQNKEVAASERISLPSENKEATSPSNRGIPNQDDNKASPSAETKCPSNEGKMPLDSGGNGSFPPKLETLSDKGKGTPPQPKPDAPSNKVEDTPPPPKSGESSNKGKGSVPPPPGKGVPGKGKKGTPPPPLGGKGASKGGPAPPIGKGGKASESGKGSAMTKPPFGRKWHWRGLTPNDRFGTVFEEILPSTSSEVSSGTQWRVDTTTLKSLFESSTKALVKAPTAVMKQERAEITIFDANRARNLQIGLMGLRNNCQVEVDHIADTLLVLDTSVPAMRNPEVIELLATVLPSAEEARQLAEVPEAKLEELRSVERQLWRLSRVPRLLQRLRLAFFAQKLRDLEIDIVEHLSLLQQAADCTCKSLALRQFLGVCLSVGMFINHGFLLGANSENLECSGLPVGGFRLESLLKLRDFQAAKHVGGGICLLHVILVHLARLVQDARLDKEDRSEVSATQSQAQETRGVMEASPESCSKRGNVEECSDVKTRRGSLRKSGSTRTIPKAGENVHSLRQWYNTLLEEIVAVPEATKSTLGDIDEEIKEIESEAAFVLEEATVHVQAYCGVALESIQRLNKDASDSVARLRNELQKTEIVCAKLCDFFGEKVGPKPQALSEATQGLLNTLTEVAWRLLAQGVEEICDDRRPLKKLPTPSALDFSINSTSTAIIANDVAPS